MSRTNKTLDGPIHPCKLWLQWSSDGSIWKAWNKETKQNDYYEASSLKFIVLDVLSTLTGYNDKAQKGYYANEVRSLKDPFRLMCDGKLMSEATWAEIKPMFSDVKFTASVYVMCKGEGIPEYTLANMKLSGASLGSWIEFVRQVGGNRALYENIVVGVLEVGSDKKGKVEYSYPIFQVVGRTLTEQASAKADELDIQLQQYLDHYFSNGTQTHTEGTEFYPTEIDAPSPVEAIDPESIHF